MMTTCPNCGYEFHAPHPHLTNEGFLPVRLHRRKKRTLYMRREDLNEDVVDRIDALEHENMMLRRKVMALKGTEEPWEERKKQLEQKALDEWETDENTGECLLCNRPMREHPPERMLSANPAFCPRVTSDTTESPSQVVDE